MIEVSIIMPVYNVAQYLLYCLQSISAQTYTNFELIAINDGSTDNSLKILEEYTKEEIRLSIIDTKNNGQGSARNLGIENAKGKYIVFVDSDDWLDKNYLKELYTAVEVGGCDIALCQTHCYDEKSNHIKTTSYFKKEQQVLKHYKTLSQQKAIEILPFITAVPWNKIYNLNFIKTCKASFYEAKAHEDIPFFFEVMFSAQKIAIVQKSLYYYRYNRPFSAMTNTVIQQPYLLFSILSYTAKKILKHHNSKNKQNSFYTFQFLQLNTSLKANYYNTPKHHNLQAYFEKSRNYLKQYPRPYTLSTTQWIAYYAIIFKLPLYFKLQAYFYKYIKSVC